MEFVKSGVYVWAIVAILAWCWLFFGARVAAALMKNDTAYGNPMPAIATFFGAYFATMACRVVAPISTILFVFSVLL